MEMADQNIIFLDNRSDRDRRTKGSFNLRLLLFGGKRSKIRRKEDTKRIFYVDQFSPGLFFVVVSIILLGVIDALFTLSLLNRGAYEANPIIKYFLEIGPYTFFIFKYILTIASVTCLLMFRNVVIRGIKIKVRSVLFFIVVFYLAIVAWNIYLISDLSDRPDFKLSPKVLIDSQIICQVDTFNTHPISKWKTPI
jgi:hypothetical protein